MIHVMLPCQYLRRSSRRAAEPHRRLMAAVLQTVVDDFRGSAYRRGAGFGPSTDGRGARQASAYVASTDRAWPYSFENLCEALGVDADGLRRALLDEERHP
jgi:hypothetical protein